MPLLTLNACDVGYARGDLVWDEDVTWSGYVFSSPDTSQETVLADGTVTFSVEGLDPVEGDQPYEDYPGYFVVSLPQSVPVEVRVESPGAFTALWAGWTPAAPGNWLAGALFGGDPAWLADLWVGLGFPDAATTLAAGDVVHVWGSPYDAGWNCADVLVGGTVPRCFAFQEDGTVLEILDGDFDYFFGFDLPPGDVVVDSGLGGVHTYPATGGEVVMAHFFVGNAT